MEKTKRWVLIDNTSHDVYEFKSLRELKEWVKKRGYKVRKSPTEEHCYYTISHTYLPTGYLD